MIGLYGYKPGIDVDIVFTGLRPGEKLDEELFNAYERVKKTSHEKINLADVNGRKRKGVLEMLEALDKAGPPRDSTSVKDALSRLIQSF